MSLVLHSFIKHSFQTTVQGRTIGLPSNQAGLLLCSKRRVYPKSCICKAVIRNVTFFSIAPWSDCWFYVCAEFHHINVIDSVPRHVQMPLMEPAWQEDFQNEDMLFVDPYQKKTWLQTIWKRLCPKTCHIPLQPHHFWQMFARCLFFLFKKSSSSEHSTSTFVDSVWLKSHLNLSYSFYYFLSWFYEYEQQSPLLKTAFSVSISSPIPFYLGMTNRHNLHQAHGSTMWRSTAILNVGVIRLSGHTS